MYIASQDRTRNTNYLGPATVEELAAQIASAHGPSGPNAEYLYRLAEAMVQVSRRLGTLDALAVQCISFRHLAASAPVLSDFDQDVAVFIFRSLNVLPLTWDLRCTGHCCCHDEAR